MTQEEINQAYSKLALEAGELQFAIHNNKNRLTQINAQMRDLVTEAIELQKVAKIAADAVAAAQKDTAII